MDIHKLIHTIRNILNGVYGLRIIRNALRLGWREKEGKNGTKHYCTQIETKQNIWMNLVSFNNVTEFLIISKPPGWEKSSTGKTKGQHFSISLRGWDTGPHHPTPPGVHWGLSKCLLHKGLVLRDAQAVGLREIYSLIISEPARWIWRGLPGMLSMVFSGRLAWD